MFTIRRAQNRFLKEQYVYADDNGYQRHNVKYDGHGSCHLISPVQM